ncbi:AfsR/SARP family transcriptional regulator [Streptomyces pactum]|uniref:AfsR/SARP family transcriptional regulator n=1 Tax=Streptomyces pactum TaxID=68249 RepID=A0ABS0NEG5_9ACTN|nr:AfsR/SARP family transcriptional regulator [Streptomyces pactum]MBH5333594.1 AfsR/SARP family transcriptional regulator [Streptomyces pactum]
MRYEILGPLRVVDGPETISVRAHKVRLLLATLLVRADREVSVEQLVTEIWGDAPPRRYLAGLHVYVSQLRKFLHRPGTAGPIVTQPPGYCLRLGTDEFDLHRFEALAEEGRALAKAERHAEATATLETALGLWRGPALSGMRDGPIVGGFAVWLDELRLESIDTLVASRMALGQHRRLVPYLYALVAEHPLRENFYRQLMVALYRSECQAEALKVFQSARRAILDELGLEPCRALQHTHRAVLAADEALLDRAAALAG